MQALKDDKTQYRYKQTATRPHHPGLVLNEHDFYENDDYVFFWESLFSNWEPAKFEHEFVFFQNSEQAMMYHKAMCFGDKESAVKVMQTDSPKEQKAIGRAVKGYDERVWLYYAMQEFPKVLVSKFTQVPGYREILLGTGDKTIVEASPFDERWGIRMGVNHPELLDPSKWKGQNLLGICLMKARAVILEQSRER